MADILDQIKNQSQFDSPYFAIRVAQVGSFVPKNLNLPESHSIFRKELICSTNRLYRLLIR